MDVEAVPLGNPGDRIADLIRGIKTASINTCALEQYQSGIRREREVLLATLTPEERAAHPYADMHARAAVAALEAALTRKTLSDYHALMESYRNIIDAQTSAGDIASAGHNTRILAMAVQVLLVHTAGALADMAVAKNPTHPDFTTLDPLIEAATLFRVKRVDPETGKSPVRPTTH